MEAGQKRIFKYRATDTSVQEAVGTILRTDRLTADGHQVIEVQFQDRVRNYSAQRVGEVDPR